MTENYQDLETLYLINKKVAEENKKKKGIASGAIKTETKNKNGGGGSAMKKLDEDFENLKVETVNTSISQTIRDNRTKLKIKQKDLANSINVPVTTIQQYENGSATKPDINILKKLERKLRCKLTGKGFTS